MEQVIQQAPINISKSKIEEIFAENNNDINKTLMILWNIKDDEYIDDDENKHKWKSIRETCDAYDIEMKKMMDNCRNNNV